MELENINKTYDLVVVGGGITGAGILLEAARMGLNVLLVEQKDFAWGTSSRSSKLVHGGLRYLKQGDLLLTRASVKERERLLKEAPGLVEPQPFLLPLYKGQGPGRWIMEIGLTLYGLLAHKIQHRYFTKADLLSEIPGLKTQELTGGFRFFDAQVDDARLVIRLVMDAITCGGHALNYTTAVKINRNQKSDVCGIVLKDSETGVTKEVATSLVINASGVWAETLHPSPNPKRHLRALRGSHLIFPKEKIPVKEAVSFIHPKDHRPVFAIPWEGVVLFGTTDVDYNENILKEPFISVEEIDYLKEALDYIFPSSGIKLEDSFASIAGVRPVLSEGKKEPSKESREHVIWVDKGLVTVTGGKLTTFRKLAVDTLKAARPFYKSTCAPLTHLPVFEQTDNNITETKGLTTIQVKKLFGRYGKQAKKIVQNALPEQLNSISDTNYVWAELKHAAANENVKHLSDLLLRRVRLGLLMPQGGQTIMDEIKNICGPHLNWDEPRWETEIRDYKILWDKAYAAPLKIKEASK